MTVYYGTVRDNVIVWPEHVALANGLKVEVHVPEAAAKPAHLTNVEAAFLGSANDRWVNWPGAARPRVAANTAPGRR